MACTNCIQSTATITGFTPANCQSTNPCYLDAVCVTYTGPALNCSGIATNDTLDIILQKIDPLLCAASGDYSTYDTFCLAPIDTQQEFVESISAFVCDLRDEFDTFTETTFPAYQASITAQLAAITSPGITCASASVTDTFTLVQVLNAYCTKFTSIDTLLAVGSADWNQCYVVTPPTTPVGAFDILIDQICALQAEVDGLSTTLPTFNNVGSCLPAPLTATDTLIDTINKIKTRLCQTGTVDTTTLSWGCTVQPTGAQNLQDTLQNILTRITAISQLLPTVFSADFEVTNVDDGDLCLGKEVALATPSAVDRFVAATASDASPSTLQGKITAGSNVTLDFITTPGQMIINSSGGTVDSFEVKSDPTDVDPAFLDTKIVAGGFTSGVQVYPSLDTGASVINLNVNVNLATLFLALLAESETNAEVQSALCARVLQCPSPCSAPTNVEVTYIPGTTTTSTTTTTTTTT